MTAMVPNYPQPRSDKDNVIFIDGWRAGRLMLQHCKECGLTFFYPRPMCPGCWSEGIEWTEASGKGEVVSYSLVYRPSDPSFFAEAPIVLAEVRLPEGAIMLARIICDDPKTVRTGMAIELLPPDQAKRYPLPAFRPR
jgi:uncharacterized OB-fold protein